MKNKIVHILDCGFGNISSVENAFNFLMVKNKTISNLDESDKITHLVIPGVGNFKSAIKKIKSKNIEKKIYELSKKKCFILGICLGMQIMFEYGDENGGSKGLGFFKGSCKKFIFKKNPLPIPHVGFNLVKKPKTKIWKKIDKEAPFYFIHEYRIGNEIKKLNTKCFFGITNYQENFVSYIENSNGNVFGAQFHPEKSQKNGLKFLENFSQLS